MRATRLAGALVLVALLAAGCAGGRTDEQLEVQGATSTAANATAAPEPATSTAAATESATSRRTSTTSQSPTATRRTTTTSQPAVNQPAVDPVLTVKVVRPPEGAGEVQVNPGDYLCPPPDAPAPECSYPFKAGTPITLTIGARLPDPLAYKFSVGKTTCSGSSCSFTLERNTTVTVTFGDQGGG